jgi:ligand-binding sensor domain-containing protein
MFASMEGISMNGAGAARLSFLLLTFCAIGLQGADTWTIFNKTNSALPVNYIRSAAIDDSGNLRVGTHGGSLAKLGGTTWTVYAPSFSDPAFSSFTSIASGANGLQWVGTDGGGLLRFDGNQWSAFTAATSGIPGDFINAVVTDSTGAVWVGTEEGGLARYAGTQWTVFDTVNSDLPDNSISSLAAGNGCIWIGVRNVYTKKGALCKITGSTIIVYDTANSGLPGRYVYAVAIDRNGVVWAGTNKGLVSFDGSQWMVFSPVNSGMPYGMIFTLSIDNIGNKWMGAGNLFPGGGGLLKLSGSQWTLYSMSDSGIPDNYVWSVACAAGTVWVGTEFGGVAGVANESSALCPHSLQASAADLHCAMKIDKRQCVITARIPYSGIAVLRIFDSRGREIARLHEGPSDTGVLKVLWPPRANGNSAGGFYISELLFRGSRFATGIVMP